MQNINMLNTGSRHCIVISSRTSTCCLVRQMSYFLLMYLRTSATTCLTYYPLDPANYVSLPGLAWDSMLLMRGKTQDLITKLVMLDMIEKECGVVFVISARRDTVRLTINTCQNMIQMHHQITSYTQMLITFMHGLRRSCSPIRT